jgi:hypothetical protein
MNKVDAFSREEMDVLEGEDGRPILEQIGEHLLTVFDENGLDPRAGFKTVDDLQLRKTTEAMLTEEFTRVHSFF